MSEHTFAEGQRVYHRQLERYGTYVVRDDLDRSTSHVEFDDDPNGTRSLGKPVRFLDGTGEVYA